jgi:hypothetical protein
MLEDISLKLLVGKPIDIDIGKVHPLKINEIVEMGEIQYNEYLNILLYDVDLLDISKENLKEMNIDRFTTYHFLLLQSYNNQDFRDLVGKALELFLKEKVYFCDDNILFYLMDDEGLKKYIDLNIFELIKKILIKQNYLKQLEEEEELIFGNEMARRWYLDLKRKEKTQPKQKSDVDLQSIISSVMWKSHKSIDEILKMTIYQLYDGYFRLSLIDNCNNLTQGIYHGAIDKKQIKESELNWAKIIKFEK